MAAPWQHPRLEEITRRLQANTFSKTNLDRILWNAAFLMAELILCSQYITLCSNTVLDSRSADIYFSFLSFDKLPDSLKLVFQYINWCVRSVVLLNIILALRPLWWKDELADIPLSTCQRRLLGLHPMNGRCTPTPMAAYYARVPGVRRCR